MILTRRNFSLAAGMAAAVALTAGALIASTAEAAPAVTIGETAPAFTGVSSTGETVSLSDYAGRTVILEWTNHDCPFVKKHYATPPANMQGLQLSSSDNDIVWLSVISSAPGEQGHVSADKANELTTTRGAAPAHVLLDETGTIGRLYDAKTTPHMFIIDGEGRLVYDGAIDSNSSARVEDIEGATNYVSLALSELAAGQPVSTPVTRPYGCSVKY